MNRHSLATLAAGAIVTLASTATARADAKAFALLKDAFDKLHAAQSVTMELNIAMTPPEPAEPVVAKVRATALKPNFFRFDSKQPGLPSFIADGKDYYTHWAGPNAFKKSELAAAPTELPGLWEGEIDAFFGGMGKLKPADVTLVGAEVVAEVPCDVVRVKLANPDRTITYAIGKADKVLRRARIELVDAAGLRMIQTTMIGTVKFDTDLKKSDFEFKPPAGAREVKDEPKPRA
jgi:outer membrane lipoprotein-sorting protein